MVIPADADPTVALPVLLRATAALLGQDNARSDDRLRLRMSVGIGLVKNSKAGFGGPMIIEMSRMVNSEALRSALDAYPRADLVAAISDQAHSAIIRPGYPGIPGAQFTRVDVTEKEFRAPAWIWVSARQWIAPAYAPLSRGDPRIVGQSNTDRYRVAARLAVGRASTVYLALAADGTQLAVKAFRPEAADTIRARLAAGVRPPPPSAGRVPRCSWTPIPMPPPRGSRRSWSPARHWTRSSRRPGRCPRSRPCGSPPGWPAASWTSTGRDSSTGPCGRPMS